MTDSGKHTSGSSLMLWSLCTVLEFSIYLQEETETLTEISMCNESDPISKKKKKILGSSLKL